ncbi:hypothetical protein ABBQ38_007031 [Trebouxia sp. C0009 RCD-2024]
MRIRKLLLAYQLAHVQETRLRSYKRLMRAKPAIPMHVYFHLICLGTVWVRRYKSCRGTLYSRCRLALCQLVFSYITRK